MKYELVEIEKRIVSGLKIRTTNEDWKCIADMGALWQDFFEKNVPGSVKNAVGNQTYGVYNNYESDLTKPYDYTAGIQVSISDSSFESITIPAGTYAKFSGKGNVQEAVGAIWKDVWGSDINRSYLCDFELYLNNSADMNNQTVEVYISVK